ncbi:MAG TPA: SDR family NAD(P)-dependent oxidoreductase [Steroidobacteraceae bacterium]|jgi:NAD(P)-dependent dehydrogenase (short-subunit alcohol dehydrogenase family)|nr:SDR family NAD(P)-dependent oxidoreductase [Steroidobacteraceae bacterium]HJY36401.1 SDR family NAD(P)-dependent oxidoreductase [Steroidobacteraceae bacterium]
MSIRFDGRVAIVTGAGAGLGRSHALALAARGARVVVNDFGGDVHGAGGSSEPAQRVVSEIVSAGGEAISHGADVANATQVADMVARTMERWGRVDILVNNAGILRDASFAKGSLEDFRKVLDVHLFGSAVCSHAVWPHMRTANYGRILMTTSTSGIYGNFGQANYGAAKTGLIGLMNVLQIEGEKYGIRVNALCPSAATRMTQGLMPEAALALMTPESVSAAAVFLVSEEAPRRTILAAIAGGYSRIVIQETQGAYLREGERTPEAIAARFGEIADLAGAIHSEQQGGPGLRFLQTAAAEAGIAPGNGT